ncbi:MAG: tetratricopeptide repeat protein [Planctomycetales bacterium]|nr:tetratricopeptide repeat protein [Planctomycetales bacterium]
MSGALKHSSLASRVPGSQRLSAIATAWERFWFAPSDPFVLSVLRWLAGGMLLYSHLIWGVELEGFFGPTGWNNADVVRSLQSDSYAWSFWWHVPANMLWPVHIACCGVLFCFWVGAFTRFTSVLSWVIAVSYAHRAMLANFGLDQIVTMLVLYLMLTPCGAYLSFDAWRRRRRSADVPTAPASSLATVGTRLIQLHLCVMYFFAGISKLQGQTWWEGDAFWNAAANYEYQSLDLTFLAAAPWIVHLVTHLTILWEVSFAAAVWPAATRPVVLLLGVGMHIGIGLFLGMWTFGLAMTFGYLSFVRREAVWQVVHGWLRLPVWAQASAGAADPAIIHAPIGLPKAGPLAQPAAPQRAAAATPLPLPVASQLATEPQIVESQIGADASAEPGTPLPPFGDFPAPKVRTPLLVVVCKSASLGSRAVEYFGNKYGWRAAWVDGLVQARELVRSSDAIVIALDPHYNLEEQAHWLQQIRDVNPRTMFVFRSEHHWGTPPSGCLQMLPQSNLREVRHGCEQLTGMPMTQQRETPDAPNVPNAPTAPMAQAPPIAIEPAPTDSSMAPRRRILPRVLLFALVCGAATGCGRGARSVETQAGASSASARDDALDRAAWLNDNGRANEALDGLAKVIAADPLNARASYLQGVAYEQVGELEKAEAAYSKCIEVDARYADAYNNRAVVRAKLDRLADAIEDLSEAVKINPDDAMAWSNLGLARHEQGEFSEAIRCYDEAERRSESAQIPFQRGNVRLAAGQQAEAVEDFTRAIKADSRYSHAFLNRGIALLELNQVDRAEQDLRQAQRLDTDMSVATLAENILETHAKLNPAAGAQREVRRWLESHGWETVAAPPFHLRASRLPTAGGPAPADSNRLPDDFDAVVLAKTADGVVCEHALLEAAIERAAGDSLRPLALFVLDANQLQGPRVAGPADATAIDRPAGLVRASSNWKPTQSDLRPHTVLLTTP